MAQSREFGQRIYIHGCEIRLQFFQIFHLNLQQDSQTK